jgi:hypothetical protein
MISILIMMARELQMNIFIVVLTMTIKPLGYRLKMETSQRRRWHAEVFLPNFQSSSVIKVVILSCYLYSPLQYQ